VSALLLSEYRGAVEALSSGGTSNDEQRRRRRAQAERHFAGYPAVRELSALVLRVAAARRDALPAAVVVEQLGARGALLGDVELFHCAVEVMHACGA